MFLRFYGDALGINEYEIESQVAYLENIASNVQKLIGRSSLFHYGPENIHVSWINALRAVLISNLGGKKKQSGASWHCCALH